MAIAKLTPQSSSENQRFLAEQAELIRTTQVDPAKEAALLGAIKNLGPDGALLNASALNRVTGLDEGLKARAVMASLATAYGEPLKAQVFQSASLADFSAAILKRGDYFEDIKLDAVVNRFVSTWQSEAPFKARDGKEIDLSTIAGLGIHPEPMPGELLKDVRGRWVPVEVEAGAPWAAFAGEAFGVVRLENGNWSAWFQNDWNKDQLDFSALSSASLQTIRDRLGEEPGFRGLARQIDKILTARAPAAEAAQRLVTERMGKLDLNTVSRSIDPVVLMGLPAQDRVGQAVKSELIALIEKLQTPKVETAPASHTLQGWRDIRFIVGDEYAEIFHAGQPLAKDGAHLSWTLPSTAGGLLELANGTYRLWDLDPHRQQGSLRARNYYALETLDTESLKGLRDKIADLAPEGAQDSIMRTARSAHPYGAAFSRLLGQLDQLLATRGQVS
ncbi:MAG: hypothetical protein U1E65_24905 [Myxococcota bacterium]